MTLPPVLDRQGSPFSASPQWVGDLFDSMLQPVVSAEPPSRHSTAFELLSVLYRHGVLSQGLPSTELDAALAGTSKPSLPTLARDFARADTTGLLAAASKLLGVPVRLRGKHVRLRGENVFTRHFVPPAAKQVPECLNGLWRALRRAAHASAGGAAFQHGLIAYAAFFAVLTIHPFADGNGRTARMFYASLLRLNASDCPILALALPLSFAEGGRRFHQAALLARSGHFGELRANMVDSVREAQTRFAPDVERLIAALDAGERAAATVVLQRIHADLCWATMSPGA